MRLISLFLINSFIRFSVDCVQPIIAIRNLFFILKELRIIDDFSSKQTF